VKKNKKTKNKENKKITPFHLSAPIFSAFYRQFATRGCEERK